MRQARRGQLLRELSPREREVLQLLAEGKSMKEVAAVLDISPRTVEFHKYRIMELLRVTHQRRARAVRHQAWADRALSGACQISPASLSVLTVVPSAGVRVA